jgi:hypothetical protein
MPKKYLRLFYWALFFFPFSLSAATWIASKDYKYEWGDPPNSEETRIPWLETKPVPQLIAANPEAKKAIVSYFKLIKKADVKIAVLGPPRVTAEPNPKFYLWIVVKGAKGKVLQEGAGRFDLKDTEGNGHRVVLLNFVSKQNLKDPKTQRSTFPFDAIVVLKKFLQ